MPSDKHPHGTTFQQAIILAIVDQHGPVTSGQIAEHYAETVKAEVAYNYQYIITRRMADRGLIKSKGAKNDAGQTVFQWRLTPAGRKLLNATRKLGTVLTGLK